MMWPPQSEADVAAITDAKKALRRAVLVRRRARPDDERAALDHARFDRLRDFIAGRLPKSVACYVSEPPEPATLQLIAWFAAQDVPILLPVITEPTDHDQLFGEPDWAPYDGPESLHRGRLSIIEPTGNPLGPTALAEADLIIVPGLAGGVDGRRLGRGGGWYDRALQHIGPGAVVVMLLNDDEVVEVIPSHGWDRRVDVIITPTRVIAGTRR
ncbi:5-formyltetrahydrofolate cyclo-ligase [Microlunatus soli]|uniref:5-formyltetrahydrofolate cyclo-ligase n=1 Tax=Microlunatus soli TaxID=630515 RepID=A0A1H1R818_9ACTN|nr:5-formyltetrahydrofolate cyclo-ligase [Microlunatus soli]SDS31927.1 5-formyltetrahydrofolate cyclo-ligase [Microlunatus soli]